MPVMNSQLFPSMEKPTGSAEARRGGEKELNYRTGQGGREAFALRVFWGGFEIRFFSLLFDWQFVLFCI